MLSGVPRTLGAEIRTMLALALPLVLAQLAQNGMSFVDTLMVGRLGPSSLAGLALGATTFTTIYIIFMAILLAVSPMVAQAVGARREGEPARVTGQALWLALALSVPGIAIFYNIAPLLTAIGLPDGSVALASGYLRAVSFGLPFGLGFVALRGFLEGRGHARPIMFMSFLGVGMNVFLNHALIFGHYGLPELGMVGTGYATATVYFAMFVAAALWLRFRYRTEPIFASMRRLELGVIREIARIGWPIGVTLGLEVGLFSVTSFLMGGFGDAVLAGHQIAMQSSSMTFMIPLGIATATAVLVGQAAGRGDPDGVRRAGALGIALAVCFMTLTGVLFWLAPRFVTGLYIDLGNPINTELIGYAVSFLTVAAMFQVVDGIQVAAQGALRGLKDTRRPMLLTLISYWLVGLTLGLALTYGLGLGPRGLWFGMVAGLGVSALLLTMRFARLSRRPRARPLPTAPPTE